MKKIVTIVGARPQFIKCAALSKEIRKFFEEVIIHTGQHYDYELSAQFFDELKIPKPDHFLDCGSHNSVKQIAEMMAKLDDVIKKEDPDCIIVFGDTNSTAAGAIVAAKSNIKLAHVEAGMREFDKSIPEETNKLITDILADFFFCPTPTSVKWLKEMGIVKNVYHVGDVMIDIIEQYRSRVQRDTGILKKFNLKKGGYVFMTCHRAANTENKRNLSEILKAAGKIDIPVVFTMHPRTKKAISNFNLESLLEKGQIIVCDPLGYIDTQVLIKNARFVLTDSGGVTKETYYYKTRGILTDKQTEWVETLKNGWNVQAGPDAKKILKVFNENTIPKKHEQFLGKGNASEKIAKKLNELLN